MYTDVTRQELSDIFTRLNDGKPLNEPEKRNASTSLIAKAVRELAKEYRSVFSNKNNKWFTDEQGNRRGPDDEVAKDDPELETIESGETEVALEASIIDSKKTDDIDEVLDDSITVNDGNPHNEDEPIVEKAD